MPESLVSVVINFLCNYLDLGIWETKVQSPTPCGEGAEKVLGRTPLIAEGFRELETRIPHLASMSRL